MINLTSDELVERLKKDKNSYLLDVRTDEEFEDSHIPDSKLAKYQRSSTIHGWYPKVG